MKRDHNSNLRAGAINPIEYVSQSRRFIAASVLATVICSACMTSGPTKRTAASPSDSQPHSVAATIPDSFQSERNWVRFDAPDGAFAVDFPGMPSETEGSVDTPIGPQLVTRFKSSIDGCDFDAGYLQRSSNVLAKLVGQNSILDSACEGTAANLGGRVVDRTVLTIDGHPSRDIRIQVTDHPDRLVIARLVITEERIYHAIASLPERTTSRQSDGKRFLDSFKFIK